MAVTKIVAETYSFTTYPEWRGKGPEHKGNIVKARKIVLTNAENLLQTDFF